MCMHHPVTVAGCIVVPIRSYKIRLFSTFGCHEFCMSGCTEIQLEQMWRHLSIQVSLQMAVHAPSSTSGKYKFKPS